MDCIRSTFRACMIRPTKPLVNGMQFDQLTDIDDLVPRNLANWRDIHAKRTKPTLLDPLHQFLFILLLKCLAFSTPFRRLCLIHLLFLLFLCESTHHRPLRSEKRISASVECFIVWGGWGLTVAMIDSEVCRTRGCEKVFSLRGRV